MILVLVIYRGASGKINRPLAAEVLVLADALAKGSLRHPRIRRLGQQIIKLAKAGKVNVKLFSREQVLKVLISDGQGTKHDLVEIVAGQFREQLGSKLPPKRKAWMREHYQLGIFDAVALALAFRKRQTEHCLEKNNNITQLQKPSDCQAFSDNKSGFHFPKQASDDFRWIIEEPY